jgi:dienelactone hydrolase
MLNLSPNKKWGSVWVGLILAVHSLAADALEDLHKSMDVNHDAVVTQAEFLDFWRACFVRVDQDGDQFRDAKSYGAQVMKQVDTNQDGRVSAEEDAALRLKHFNSLDKNKDGRMTLAEILKKPEPASTQTGYESDLKAVAALGGLVKAPGFIAAEGFGSSARMKAIFYEGLDWEGKKTKVFAWIGLPEQREGPVPGIVLVHGGGGTAFKNWVEEWTDRGYAAISIAVEGQTDLKPESGSAHKHWRPHTWAGPQRVVIYGDSAKPLRDQWMYHAVADTILANSLLRSLPQVDANRVGIMGISWGGVITSTVMGIDSRFAFAIPVYGCGNLSTAGNGYGRSLGGNEHYKQVWDPILRLSKATMPSLWFSWPGDQHFPLDLQASCYREQSGPHMVANIPGLGHGHGPPWSRPESYTFADSLMQEGRPWCLQLGQELKEGVLEVRFASAERFDDATLVWTADDGFTGKCKWQIAKAKAVREGKDWLVQANVPDRATACFINIKCEGRIASSDYLEIQ